MSHKSQPLMSTERIIKYERVLTEEQFDAVEHERLKSGLFEIPSPVEITPKPFCECVQQTAFLWLVLFNLMKRPSKYLASRVLVSMLLIRKRH